MPRLKLSVAKALEQELTHCALELNRAVERASACGMIIRIDIRQEQLLSMLHGMPRVEVFAEVIPSLVDPL